MEAKNKKNNSLFQRAIKRLVIYNAFNTQRDIVDGKEDNEKEMRKINKQCEKSWDSFMDALYELPMYEQKRINKAMLNEFQLNFINNK
jgi:hypothetical protein